MPGGKERSGVGTGLGAGRCCAPGTHPCPCHPPGWGRSSRAVPGAGDELGGDASAAELNGAAPRSRIRPGIDLCRNSPLCAHTRVTAAASLPSQPIALLVFQRCLDFPAVREARCPRWMDGCQPGAPGAPGAARLGCGTGAAAPALPRAALGCHRAPVTDNPRVLQTPRPSFLPLPSKPGESAAGVGGSQEPARFWCLL